MVELGDSRLVVVLATSTTFLGCALNNVVVRLRANYRPKGGLSATAFSVAKRTYKTEVRLRLLWPTTEIDVAS